MEKKTFSTQFAGKEVKIETGIMAQAANASILITMGETVLLVTAVMSKHVREGMNWFPLMVDYEEKLYAAGRIKGSRFIKREGRPTDEAVLVSRFIDRAIRPLFDGRIKNDVQVMVTALSFDGENDPDILGLIGASCVLTMSDIPWNGPIGAIRVSKIGDEWLFNPTYAQREEAEFDLDIAGNTETVVMVEARADETKEADLEEAFKRGRAEMQPILDLIEEVRASVGKEKVDLFTPKNDEAKAKLEAQAEIKIKAEAIMREDMKELFFAEPKATKGERVDAKAKLEQRLVDKLTEEGVEESLIKYAKGLAYDFTSIETTRMILEEDHRLDGRALDEMRPISVANRFLPRTHGSALFARGETQALSIVTLGSPGDAQLLDGMETVETKRYMHHYNFPPYSVGEAKPLRGAGRREIGHGALAEKALAGMIPEKEDFPYTIRVVSETVNSNGSSSMASTCGSTIALMDAGVPIKAPVAGVAVGLASNGDDYKVIMDLQDLEDGPGGMDFKITGTRDGVTAIQMDTKTQGLNHDIVVQALAFAKKGRNEILDEIEKLIPEVQEMSAHAPRILKMTIDPEKIRDVIGPGGKMINKIIEETGVETIDIEQDGLVMITAKDGESGQLAYDWVHNLTRAIEKGETFEGEVVKLMDFGAFVNVLPGKDGMVHVSELAPWRVEKVGDIVKLGDKVHVKVIEIDSMGRVNLSMKQAEGNVYTDEMKAKASKPRAPRDDKKSPGTTKRPPPVREK